MYKTKNKQKRTVSGPEMMALFPTRNLALYVAVYCTLLRFLTALADNVITIGNVLFMTFSIPDLPVSYFAIRCNANL